MKRDTKEQAAAKRIIKIMNEALSIIENDFPEVHPNRLEAAFIATDKALMCIKNVAQGVGVSLD